MSGLQEYKCPCCSGSIEWNAKDQMLKCPFCETEFELDTLQSYEEDLSEDDQSQMNWNASASGTLEEASGLKAFVCKSCAGEIIVEENTGATSCPYCGNAVIEPIKFSGDLKPDFVIPFKTTKDDAKAAYKNHLKDKKFLPKVFSNENHIEEIKGIYVPFWLFDAEADARGRFMADKVNRWSDDEFHYEETKHYSVSRNGTLDFDHVAIDGSSKLADDLMESIEPFDFKEAVDFNTGYLAGYCADRYDVQAEAAEERANERIINTTEKTIRDSVKGYDSVITKSCFVKLRNAERKYALYPVWLLNTKWQGEQYVFAMNGQTGKFVGNLPADKGAYRKSLLGTWAVTAAAVFVALSVLWFVQ